MGDVTLWRFLLFLLVVTFSDAFNDPPALQDNVASRVIAKLGRNTKLRCPADSNPDLTTWKKDGQTLNLGFGRYQVSSEGVLRIRNIQMTDAAVYTCVAVNGYGSININYTVIVLDEKNKVFQENGKLYKQSPNEDLNKEGYIPVFPDLSNMESKTLRKPTGSILKLVCKVEGYPEPEVQWFKDGELFNNERQSHVTLKIHHVSEADSGKYTCVATNRLGHRNFTYNVHVIGKIQEKPRLIAPHPLNRTVAVGGYVSFQCHIESVVEPIVQWLKRVDSHEEIPEITLNSDSNEKYRVLKNAGILLEKPDGSFLNKLVIQHVRPQDAGKFACLAVNKVGSSSRHAFLHIRPDVAGDDLNPSLLEARSSDDNSDNSKPSSQNSSDDINLPLFIGLPACALLVIIILTIIFMQRNNRCRCSNPEAKVPRTPVPPQEREAYYYGNCQQQQHLQQSINPLLQQSVEKTSKTPTPSADLTGSEFSSVSRSHHTPHYYHHNNHQNNHQNYGY